MIVYTLVIVYNIQKTAGAFVGIYQIFLYIGKKTYISYKNGIDFSEQNY